MRTVTISTRFSYMVGTPEEHIKAIRDKANNDVTDAFRAAAKAAITYYYDRGAEEFSAESAPFLVVKKEGGNVWQINDKQTGEFIFGSVPSRVSSNNVTIQKPGDLEPRVQRTIYISQDYTTCVPE